LQEAKLVRYQAIKGFKYDDFGDKFQFIVVELASPAPAAEAPADDGKKKKKKKDDKAAKPELKEVTYSFSTHQVRMAPSASVLFGSPNFIRSSL
jgi:hypothetical protein